MSKFAVRSKPTRGAYQGQSPYSSNSRRKSSASLQSHDDSDIAYRSTPDYLKRLMHASNGHSERGFTRTHSASEISSGTNIDRPGHIGNPKYKAQEDYYDEVQSLKKELKYSRDESSALRAKIRRLEEDNARKCHQIDDLYDPTKNGDLRRTLAGSSASTANIVMSLKQRLFKLELQLKQRETLVDEMKNDPRWTRGTELEIQNRALFNELEKQKLEQLNLVQNDYMTSLNEETKNVIRKMETERQELKAENEQLTKRVHELEQLDHEEQLSGRKPNGTTERDLLRKMEDLKDICQHYEDELGQIKDNLKQMRRERDKYRDKLENAYEDREDIKRDQHRTKLSSQTSRSSTHAIRRYSNSPHESNKQHSGRLRRHVWTSDDEYRVKTFRENRAARIIQRGWRRYAKPRSKSFKNKPHQTDVDRRRSQIAGMKSPASQSPRASQPRLGSKLDNFGSGAIKNRPISANLSNDAAVKVIQASLRGYIDRSALNQPSRTPTLPRRTSAEDDDDHIAETLFSHFGSRYGSATKRGSFVNTPKKSLDDTHDQSAAHHRNSSLKFHRSPSPTFGSNRTSAGRLDGGKESKQFGSHDQNKLGSGTRLLINDQDYLANKHPSLSPRVRNGNDSKQSLISAMDKHHSGRRTPRESLLSFKRSSSPPTAVERSPHRNTLSSSRTPMNSKPTLGRIDDNDDDDVFGF